MACGRPQTVQHKSDKDITSLYQSEEEENWEELLIELNEFLHA
jgi:hypothetical protein